MDKTISKDEIKSAARKRWIRIAIWTVPLTAAAVWGITLLGGKTVKSSDITLATVERGPL